MPRLLSYRDQAQAGAMTLNRMEDDAVQERRYKDQLARQDRQEERAVDREDRLDKSAQLDQEMQQYAFQKTKTLDENAKRMKIETDKQAIEANEALFKINTAEPDAPLKLAEWGSKYFRVLDDKIGDPRLIRQFEINQTRAESARMYRSKLEDEQKKLADMKATAEETRKQIKDQGLVSSGASVGDDGKLHTTYVSPKNAKQAPVELYQDALASSAPVYGVSESGALKDFKATESGKDPQTHVKVAFQDPSGKPRETVIERNLFDSMVAASVARKQGAAMAGAPAVSQPTDAAAPVDFNSPEEYKAAFAAAAPGSVLHYKGKAYTKPAAK